MDRTDEQILNIMKDDARISFQELGDRVGISRVAAMKRVRKMEEAGIIRGYKTDICRGNESVMLIEVDAMPEKYDKVVETITTRMPGVRQVFRITGKNRIHIVTVSDSAEKLKYLVALIQKKCGGDVIRVSAYMGDEAGKDVKEEATVMNERIFKLLSEMDPYMPVGTMGDFVKRHESTIRFNVAFTKEQKAEDIAALDLGVRANNSLRRAGFHTVGSLVDAIEDKGEERSRDKLLHLRNLGQKTADEIMLMIMYYQFRILPECAKGKFVREVVELNSGTS